jgi:hypothetical protein
VKIGGPTQRLIERNGRLIARISPSLGFYGRFLRGKL